MRSIPWAICTAVLGLAIVAVVSVMAFLFFDGQNSALDVLIVSAPILVGLGFGVSGAWRRAKGIRPTPPAPLGPWGKVLWNVLALFLCFWALVFFMTLGKVHDPAMAGVCVVFAGAFVWGAVRAWKRIGVTGQTEESGRPYSARDPKTGEWAKWDRRQR
ncbi:MULTISPECIES: hypothetical protein [unclassified Streptomyces]|uniref:hypothetical protein n=1 Tax=unclassified Streptomyces TaxID=2593676 RepID=UPI00381B3A62